MPREKLNALHAARLQKLVRYAYENSPFYRKKFDAIGLAPDDVRTVEDFKAKVPLTDKQDFLALQEEKPVYGETIAAPGDRIVQHAETSGTTGAPLAIPYTQYDTMRYGESWCSAYWATGIRPSDSFYFAFGWGSFAGFWSAYWGVRRFGGRLISGGGLTAEGHIKAILRLKPTVLVATPTFAVRLASVAREMGVNPEETSIRYTMHAGEPGPTALPALRKSIVEAWGAENAGELLGIAEIGAFAPCNSIGDGVHVDEMAVFSWVMNPETGKEAAEGEIGENIITSYSNSAQPLLNYRTHDLVRPRLSCPSGRTWVKFEGAVLGRTDFMVTLRGTNVYQTAVEQVLGDIDAVSSSYELHLTHQNGREEMEVRFEPQPGVDADESLSALVAKRLHQALKVRIGVVAVGSGSLPRYDLKTRRIFDHRPAEFRRLLDR
ncbi:MAG: AMP-binding protein [Alphaproteobacteria bacterium]|nr:AMP-binding protein [Alphaproteobacteria bacterium]